MIVKVSLEDISRGQRWEGEACPVALALARTFGKSVFVGEGDWYFEDADDFVYTFSRRTSRFIKVFDGGASVQPFRFRVTL